MKAIRSALLALSLGLAAGAAQARDIVVSSKIDTEGGLLGNMILLALQNDIKRRPGDVDGAILSGFYLHLYSNLTAILHNDDVPAAFDDAINKMQMFNNKLSTAARAAA